jgi:hypothetical protein
LLSQLAQDDVGLALQARLALQVASEGGANLRDDGLGQDEDLGFAVLAIRQSGRSVGFTLEAAAMGFAAFAAQADE